jgi:hypothetical protein
MSLALYNGKLFLDGNPTRFQVSEALNQANTISRNAKLEKAYVLPCCVTIAVISTVSAGVFFGAPFFVITAIINTLALADVRNWHLKKLEDLDNISTYFQNRKPFTFADSIQPEKIVKVLKFDYSTFVLEKSEASK